MFTNEEFTHVPMGRFNIPQNLQHTCRRSWGIPSDKTRLREEQKVCTCFSLCLCLVLKHQEALSVDRAHISRGERERAHSLPALDPRAPMPATQGKQKR